MLQGHKVQDVLFVDGWMAVASLPGGHHSSSADVDFLVTVWRTGVDADGADRPRLQAEIPFRALHLHLQMDADFVVVVVSRSGQTSRRVHGKKKNNSRIGNKKKQVRCWPNDSMTHPSF